MDVYFDDFRVTHEYGDIVAGGDHYPFGLAMDGRQVTRDPYRYGYQGQFSEKDEETGWNSFEARQWDARIGRWLSVDPSRQYYSSYLGMDNNPVIGVDPDGRFSRFGAWWRNGFSMNGVYEYGGEWGYSRNFSYTDVSEFGALEGVGHNFVYKDGLSGTFQNGALELNANLTAGGGFTVGAGIVWDKNGFDFYSTYGMTVGLDASIGVGFKNITPNSGYTFSRTDYIGYGGSDDIGVLYIDVEIKGGNNKRSRFASNYGKTYMEKGVGVSAGTPLGYTKSYTHTQFHFR